MRGGSRKFQFQIQNLRAIEAEALHEECFGAREIRCHTSWPTQPQNYTNLPTMTPIMNPETLARIERQLNLMQRASFFFLAQWPGTV